jgi:hypothetical protein
MKLDRTALALLLVLGVAPPVMAQETPVEVTPAPAEDGGGEVAPTEEAAEPAPEADGSPAVDEGEQAQDEEAPDEQAGEAAPTTVDPDADPNYGTVDLVSGFTPDPHQLTLLSGGEIDASALSDVAYCTGFIDDAPDYRLNYTSGDFPLYISATSAADVSLVVRSPDGQFLCDDDSAGDYNPRVTLEAPQSGSYEIWVGTYGGPEFHDTTLEISELAPDDSWETGYGDLVATVSGEVHVRSGFKPDPLHFPVTAGGSVEAYTLDPACYGYLTEAPTFRIHFTAGVMPLTITAVGITDTTLMVRDTSGYTHCDDDTGGNLDAQVTLDNLYDGPIDIWVGTYDGTASADVMLRVSELE